MAASTNHALVFGASGLLGWSVTNELLSSYPEAGTFAKVTAVMNRPVLEDDLCFPKASSNRPELRVMSGVNLLKGSVDELAEQLTEGDGSVSTITHVFYMGKFLKRGL